jgi:hypothetical protein
MPREQREEFHDVATTGTTCTWPSGLIPRTGPRQTHFTPITQMAIRAGAPSGHGRFITDHLQTTAGIGARRDYLAVWMLTGSSCAMATG